MSNKIGGTESRPVRIAPGSAAPRSSSATTSAKPESKAADIDVRITGTALHLAALEQSIRDLPPVDKARVAAVQQRLEGGDYHLDAQRVAAGLLYMNALLGLDV